MKEKIKPFLNIISAYKMLLLMWFAEGLMVLITGRINRIIYGCVWLCVAHTAAGVPAQYPG